MTTILERLHPELLTATATGPCVLWPGAKNTLGYGKVGRGGKTRKAHRVTYEIVRGPIPDSLTLDHLCRTPSCVNPWHLEAVTMAVNNARSDSTSGQNARKTHCCRGHLLSAENVYLTRHGHRRCRTCYLAWAAQRRDADRDAVRVYNRDACRRWYERNRERKNAANLARYHAKKAARIT